MAVTRREVLTGGAAAALLWPTRGFASVTGEADIDVRAALDSVAALPTPAAKLARLRALSTVELSHRTMLDLVTARQGLAIDVRLAALFPDNRPGEPPYPVSPRRGVWRQAVEAGAPPALATQIDADTRALRTAGQGGVVLPQPFLDRTVTALKAAATRAAPPVAAALARQAAELAMLRGKAGAHPGVWQLPHGDEFYALLLDRQLGEPIDPAAAHDRLMTEWQRLAAQSDKLLAAQGFRSGSIGDRFRTMFRGARWHYPDTSAGRDQAVTEMNALLARSRARVPVLIGPVPPYCLTVQARRMSPVEEAAGKGGYRIVAGPDTQGVYFVDLGDISRRPSWSLGSVVHHELLPGHMIQMPIEAAAAPHPLRLEYAPAFTEGWSVYAEGLTVDTGAFAGDVPKLLGYLHWALFRIGRGIVDTGIHHARWTIGEALDRLYEVQGEPAYFAPFESDIDRICLDPGIRAAEALLSLRFADLRRDAMRKGGDGAAMRRLHQLVLADGRKRLTTIEAELNR